MLFKSHAAALRGWFHRLQTRTLAALSSQRFFYVIIGLLAFQALWIALSAQFPQAFDEDFHFGLIQLHAQQWLPFFAHQPAGAEVHGAVVRDPSYLYHYLLSFPYRLLSVWTSSLAVQVIALRLINIGMFIGGLFVYRALLTRLGLSRRLIHTILLFFVLTPAIPLLAANINYDNLVFLLTAALLLYVVRFIQALENGQKIDIAALALAIVYGLVTALVKYTSLPVTLAAMVLLGYVFIRSNRRARNEDSRLEILWPRRMFVVLSGFLIVILLAGCFERYGVNMLRYHALEPDCAAVLSVNQCHAYAVWERDYEWSQLYPNPSAKGIAVYPFVWFHRMVFETMFTIGSYFGADGTVQYVPAPPLTVVNYTAWALVLSGLACVAAFWRRLWRQRYLRYLLIISLFYTLILFGKNFSQYMYDGEAVAIHGRYLVPVYPLLYAALALALGYFFEWLKRSWLKVPLVLISLLLLAQGAGLITWIYRADPRWYWSSSQDAPVYEVNRPVQAVVHRITIP